MGEIARIKPPQQTKRMLRVAAYARISVENARSPKSLSLQVSHYSDLIQSTPGWEYAGVYADSGISGTTTNRPQFQAMLASARQGNIDLILTKSISRFARNTVDLLEVVRELNSLGVEVRFEKENISTATADGEFMLTLLASFAQAESEQISANVKWRVRKQFEQGLANGFHMYGYTASADATDVRIIESEAEIIRRAFAAFLDKVSMERLVADLTSEGVYTREGKPFSPEVPREWLSREAYTGTLTLGRFHSTTFGEHTKHNRGEEPMYRVEDAIPAIIDKETFEAVQVERARRRQAGALANWSIPTTILTSRIRCTACDCSFAHASRKRKSDRSISTSYWICSRRREGKKTKCGTRTISESAFKAFLAETLGIPKFDEAEFNARVHHIDVTAPDNYTIHFTNGTRTSRQWKANLKRDAWTPAKKEAWSQLVKARWAEAKRTGVKDARKVKTPPEALAHFRAVSAAEAKRLRAEREER